MTEGAEPFGLPKAKENDMNDNLPRSVKAEELRIGDRVRLPNMDAWNTVIVKDIDGDSVRFFRPYGTTCGFTCTGGTICYVGIEEFSSPRDGEFVLLYREEMR
jgi:hypothetical protein